MRRLLISLPLCLASAAALAGSWSDLWSTPDQQGQRLLDRHQPAAAAKLFTDPRRRAYAELQAGHYPQAAELLRPFTDAGSQYNRGNALARAGQLKEALTAYDAALKQTPADKDIRHNRDLVAKALEQQKRDPRQQQQQNNSSGSGHGQSQSSQGGAGQASQRDQGQSSQGSQGQGAQAEGNPEGQQDHGKQQAGGNRSAGGNSQSSASSESQRSDARSSEGSGSQAGGESSESAAKAARGDQPAGAASAASSQAGSAQDAEQAQQQRAVEQPWTLRPAPAEPVAARRLPSIDGPQRHMLVEAHPRLPRAPPIPRPDHPAVCRQATLIAGSGATVRRQAAARSRRGGPRCGSVAGRPRSTPSSPTGARVSRARRPVSGPRSGRER